MILSLREEETMYQKKRKQVKFDREFMDHYAFNFSNLSREEIFLAGPKI